MDWTRHLRLKHLSLLLTLAETGSLSETARTSFTTQPALSRWLKELEEDVGGALFERHARGLTPTDLGKMLISHARRIVTELERAQQNLEAVQAGSTRSIAIGTSPASAPYFVPAAISRFLQIHPKSRVEVQESTMNDLMAKLALGELDVVVGRLDNYRPQADFRNEILYSERILVVSRLSHPLAQRSKLTWDDLYQYDWIVWPDGTPIRSKLDEALTRSGLKPPYYRVESTSQVGNLWLLQYTDMLSIASERVAAHFYDRGLMFPLTIDINCEAGAVGMCWHESRHQDELVKDLLDCCRESKAFI